MKKMLLIAMFIVACKKEQPASPADIARAAEIKTFLQGKAIQLVSYTSTNVLDYDKDDTIPAATNHWRYVPYNITDDSNVIHDNMVTVYQGTHRSADISADHFDRPFDVYADSKGVHVKYMSHLYEPLTYSRVDRTDSIVTLYYSQNGGDLVSVFRILK